MATGRYALRSLKTNTAPEKVRFTHTLERLLKRSHLAGSSIRGHIHPLRFSSLADVNLADHDSKLTPDAESSHEAQKSVIFSPGGL